MDEDNLNNNNEHINVKKSYTKVFVAVVLVVAVIIIGVVVFLLPKDRGSETGIIGGATEEKSDLFSDLKGTVYLTLALKDDNAADIYTFDIETHRIDKVVEDAFVKYTASVSPSGNKLAYFASSLDRESGFEFPFRDYLQLYFRDLNSGAVEQITESFLSHAKRLPVWSPSGKRVAYAGLPDGDDPFGGFNIVNSWSVYVSDLEGNETLIGLGSYPQWSPDGMKILLMKDDGLYLYDVKNSTSVKAFSAIRGSTTNNMKIKVSPDGTMLAWSRPRTQGELTVYKISSWDPFQMEELNSIRTQDTDYYWPVFSPNGQYIIVEAIDNDTENGTRVNPRIIAYDVETMESLVLLDLKRYNFDVSFITDWR